MSDREKRPAATASASSPRATTTAFSLPTGPFRPPGQGLRRAVTVEEAAGSRRRPSVVTQLSTSEHENAAASHLHGSIASPTPIRRRSSTFSDYSSMSDGRHTFRESTDDLLNLNAALSDGAASSPHESFQWTGLPLAIALAPAFGGVLFRNGSAIITDIMLLGLAFIFLRWTITHPWEWYHAAMAKRQEKERELELIFETYSDDELTPEITGASGTLEDVPEEPSVKGEQGEQGKQGEQDEQDEPNKDTKNNNTEQDASQQIGEEASKMHRARSVEAALKELYMHEVLSLLSCFAAPAIGSYLLHTIRIQLSRPSEGLLTNFNICIFLLAAEIRPLSHAMKLVLARTHHLQRIVQAIPFPKSEVAVMVAQVRDVSARLHELEMRSVVGEVGSQNGAAPATGSSSAATSRNNNQGAAIVREVRNAIQPELDALNRAVRRYEKKATVLALQTEGRLGAMDARLGDAIALAAAAAKQSHSQWSIVTGFVAWMADSVVRIVLLPFHMVATVVMLPFRALAGLFSRRSTRRSARGASGRTGRSSGKAPATAHAKLGSGSDPDRYRERDRDRVPSRISRR